VFGKIYDFFKYINYLVFRFRCFFIGERIEIINTELPLKSKVCIFASFGKVIPKSTIHYLKEIQKNDYSIIYVSPVKLITEEIDKIKNYCSKIILRENHGYDFGSYKCGWGYLQESNHTAEYLLLTNDSVFAPLHDISPIFADFYNTQKNWGGIVENFSSNDYHIASWFLLFKRPLIESKTFQNFWDTYKLKSSRRNAIRNGEVRLSQTLINKGEFGRVFFSNLSIIDKLKNSSYEENIALLKDDLVGTIITEELFDHKILNNKNLSLNISTPEMYSAIKHDFLFDTLDRNKILIGKMTKILCTKNVTHQFYLTLNHLKSPFLKKDLIVRMGIEAECMFYAITSSTDFDKQLIIEETRKSAKLLGYTAGTFKKILSFQGYM
jgi:lipopolysaccharide biosynthesis protein